MSTQVGSAHFDIQANPAQALKAVQTVAREAQRQLGSLALKPQLDRAGLQAELKKVGDLKAKAALTLRGPTQSDLSKAVGDLKARLAVELKPVAQSEANKAAQGVKARIGLEARPLPQGEVNKAVQGLKGQIGLTVRPVSTTEVSRALKEVVGRVAVELRPATQADANRAVKGLKAELGVTLKTASQRDVDRALKGLKDSHDILVGIKGDPVAKINTIRNKLAELKTAAADVVKVDASALNALVKQLKEQVRELNAVEAKLRTLRLGSGGSTGAGTGGGSPGVRGGTSVNTQQLVAQLERLNNEYKRGDVSAEFYGRRLQQLKTQLELAARGAAAGSTDFKALDRAITSTSQGMRQIQTDKITALRTQLASARAAFDAAAASATNLAQRRAAIAAYHTDLNRLEADLRAMATSGRLTAAQLGQVQQRLGQIARERNTINGGVNVAGLSGNILNALQTMGGPLGMVVSQATALSASFGSMAAAAGPVGVALGAVTAAVVALGAAMAATVGPAAQFEQVLVDIKALTQPTTEELLALRQATMDIGTPLGVGAREAAAAVLELNRAGLDASEAVGGGLAGALTLAGAAGLSAAEGSRIAVGAMTAFEMSAQDLPRIADVFANFSNKTFLGAEDLSQALAAVGPTAKSAGLNIEEFAGYMATLAQGGFKNMSDAGTSMKTMLLSLQAPAETGAAALNDLKLQVYDSAENMRPLGVVLDELRGKLAGLTEQERNSKLKDIFGTDAIRAAQILMGDFSKSQAEASARIQENIQAMGLQGEAARVAQERNESFAGQVRILKATFEQLVVVTGEQLLPALTALVSGTTTFLDAVKNGGPVLDELRGYLVAVGTALAVIKGQALAATFASWVAGAGGLSAGLARLSAMFATATASATAFGARLVLAANAGMAFGGVQGAIARVAAALRAVTVAGTAAVSGLTLAVTAAAALAVVTTKLMSEIRQIEDATANAVSAQAQNTLDNMGKLRAKGTAEARALAVVLADLQMLQNARLAGDTKGEEQAQRNLEIHRQALQKIREEESLRAQAAKTSGAETVAAVKLTDEQLKKQAETIKEIRAELDKPVKLFGGTEFQGQLDQVAQRYEELRNKLREGVPDEAKRNQLSRELLERQQKEEGQIRAEYSSRARDAAAAAERQVQQARISAMAEGSARIQAQAQFDIAEVRRQAQETAKAWADFPEEKARILAAGEAQAAQIQAEANRKSAESDRRVAEETRRAEAEARKAGVTLKRKGQVTRQTADEAERYAKSVDSLKGAIGEMTDAEIRSRIATERSADAQGRRLALLETEIATRQRLRQEMLAQNDIENRIAAAQNRVSGYEGSIQNARSPQEAWQVAQAGGRDAQRAREQEMIAAAEREYNQVKKRYEDQIEAERKAGRDTTRLAEQGAAALRLIKEGLQNDLLQSRQQFNRDMRQLEQAAANDTYQQASEQSARLRTLSEQDAQEVVSRYESAKAAAQGNAQKLLQVEETLGREALAARQRLAQLSAEGEIDSLRATYRGLMQTAQERGESTVALETQLAAAIQNVRDKRNATQLENQAAFNRSLNDLAEQSAEDQIRIANETATRLRGLSSGEAQAVVDRYDFAKTAAGDSLPEQLRVEETLGRDALAARQELVRIAAEDEIAQTEEKYRILKEEAEGNEAELTRLQAELGRAVNAINDRSNLTQLRNQQDFDRSLVEQRRAVADALLQVDRDLADARNQRVISEAERYRDTYENQIADRVKAAGDEVKKVSQIYKAEEVSRLAAAESAIKARVAAEEDAENTRFSDLKTRLEREGLWNERHRELELDHQARLTEITTKGETDRANETREIRQQTQEAQAKVHAEAWLKGLDEANAETRQRQREGLQGWLKYYQRMGQAGADAAAVIQAALKQIGDADTKALENAVTLAKGLYDLDEKGGYQNADAVRAGLARRTDKLTGNETRAGVETAARESFDGELKALRDGIANAEKVIEELARIPADQLTAQQSAALEAARTYLPIFEAQLPRTVAAAEKAGKDAGEAFSRGLAERLRDAQDAAASAAVALAEAQMKADAREGKDSSGRYVAALASELALAKTRVDEYRAALETARAKEAEVRAGVAAGTATQDDLTAAVTATATAQSNLASATNNVLDTQDKLRASNSIVSEGMRALEDARRNLNGLMGISTISYRSEIDGLNQLMEKYPAQRAELEAVRKEYERIQAVRNAGVANADSFKLDMKIGQNAGTQQLQGAISNFAQGIGQLTNPMTYLAAILEKINPVTETIGVMLEILAPVLDAFKEPFIALGQMLASSLIPGLTLLANIITPLVSVFTGLYDALAQFLKSISFGFIDITRRDIPSRKKEQEEVKKEDESKKDIDVGKLQSENDLTELERLLRRGLVSQREYERRKLELTLNRLKREREAELKEAEGNAQATLEINRKYDGLELDARLDMLDKLSEAYRAIGESLRDSITGSISSGLLSALKAGNFGAFRSEFRRKFREAMFEAVLNAAIETAAFQSILQPAIDGLTAALQTLNPDDDQKAIQGLLKAGAQAEGKARDIYSLLKPLRDRWGITSDEQAQENRMEIVGKVDTPEMKISLDMLGYLAETIRSGLPPMRSALEAHTPVLLAHTPVLAANTAAMPQFVTAVDAFGLQQQTQAQHVAAFGGHVGQFGGHVAQFGRHVAVLADAVKGGNFTSKR